MEIYILIRSVDHEGYDVIGVYSTPEKAKDLNNLKDWGKDSLLNDEWGPYSDGDGWVIGTRFGCFYINKWTVE